jgi:hypothetical protein
MRRAGTYANTGVYAMIAALSLPACTYDFDSLVATPGSAGTGGASGDGGASGAAADSGASGTGGLAGQGGAGGAGGSAGRAGDAATVADTGTGGHTGTDAALDRAPSFDVRADRSFDCGALGGTVYQGHCYYPSAALTNWDAANATACAAPSHLAVITTSGEQMIVAAILSGKDRWLGLRKDPGPPNVETSFRWVTGEALAFRSWDAYDSGAPEPNYTGDCVRMRTTNQWGDTACTEMYGAVCERE